MNVTLKCDTCEKEFIRDAYEAAKNARIGRKTYCSRSCSGRSKVNLKRISKIGRLWTTETSQKLSNNKRDEYTDFRTLYSRMKLRNKKIDVTLADLKDIWSHQNEECVYSKVKLTLPTWKRNSISKFRLASIDRIDSSKGYIKGNIQFISATCNYAKNEMSHEEMLEFCKLIRLS